MKIVHIAPNSPYNDYWGYQDNLLPKYQEKLGHDVTIITTNTAHINGVVTKVPCGDYRLDDGVRVIRVARKEYGHHILSNMMSYLPVYSLLCELQPEFIFFHGLVSSSIFDAIRYLKQHPNCKMVQDNHLDYNIGTQSKGLALGMIKAFYRARVKKTVKWTQRVYGVTPWRKTYAEDFFKVPADKTDVLIMGADDEKIRFDQKTEIRKAIREKFGIEENDFLVVTGGKIDRKKHITELMQAVDGLENVKLLVFGGVLADYQEEFEQAINGNVQYIGWVDADTVYDYFFAADLVVFPGQHSVLWEQACAAKVPCVFQRWEGMEHINNGGNSDFFEEISVSGIREKILQLRFTPAYEQMKAVAESENTDIYLYSKIAEKSLECAG